MGKDNTNSADFCSVSVELNLKCLFFFNKIYSPTMTMDVNSVLQFSGK